MTEKYLDERKKKVDRLKGALYYLTKEENGETEMDPHEKERLRLKAEVFKAMGNPLRLGVIEFLQSGEMCVCDIVEHTGTGISNISKHLSILKKAGIVNDRREGLKIMYSLTMPCALDFARCVEGVVVKRLDDQRSVMVA